jgi:hypothetical protein
MARGRFISQEITKDKKINSLSDDTSRLAFTWLVTMADCEGRTYGDPAIVRSMVFPRRSDVTIEQMEAYIREWHNSSMVLWYESDGDMWIAFPNFEKHQVGLRKDKEAPSVIPPPPESKESNSVPTPDLVQSNSVLDTDENGLIKEKLIKDEVDNGGPITPFRELSAAVVEYAKVSEFTGGPEKWSNAIREMLKAGATPEDIKDCVDDYTRKGMNIVGASSLVNGVVIAVSKRKRGANGNQIGGYTHA